MLCAYKINELFKKGVTMPTLSTDKPLVYACSGCSNVAQLANDVALTLDRTGVMQMSCIAGVGGNIKSIVKLAQSGRPILALDGCKLNCVKQSLALQKVTPTWHIEITQLGYKKQQQLDCDLADSYRLLQYIYQTTLHTSPSKLN